MSMSSIKIVGNMVLLLEGGLSFSVSLSEIKLLKNSPIKLHHPMGWCTHTLSEQEIALIKKAKKRWNMVYK